MPGLYYTNKRLYSPAMGTLNPLDAHSREVTSASPLRSWNLEILWGFGYWGLSFGELQTKWEKMRRIPIPTKLNRCAAVTYDDDLLPCPIFKESKASAMKPNGIFYFALCIPVDVRRIQHRVGVPRSRGLGPSSGAGVWNLAFLFAPLVLADPRRLVNLRIRVNSCPLVVPPGTANIQLCAILARPAYSI